MQSATLVIRLSSLGDIVLTSPAVLNLRISNPDARLLFLTKERYRQVAEMLDGVDEVVTVADHATPAQLFRLSLQLEDFGIDRIVDLHGNLRSWFVRNTVTANNRVVYPKRRLQRRAAVRRHHKVIGPQYPHTIDLYNEAVKATGARIYARRPVMTSDEANPDEARFLAQGGPFVLIAPGAAHPNKQWSIDRFVDLATRLRVEQRAGIIWALAGNDPATVRLREQASAPGTLVREDYPITRLAALLARVDLTISNDSGVGHLSSAVGTPTIVLFGPTHPVLGFAPRGIDDRVLQIDEPCRPCSLHGATPCYREERYCFTRMSVDMVHLAAVEMLEHRGRKPALLIDRDGTLIVNKHYLADPDQVELIEGSAVALRMAQEKGFRVAVLSNQSGVARGIFPFEMIERVNNRIAELLRAHQVEVDGFYSCPHYRKGQPGNPYAVECECRKPRAGLAEQAAHELGLDLRRSVVIGDSLADMNLARVIGARRILVQTGYGREDSARVGPGTEVASNLLDAVRSVLRHC